MLRVGLTGGLCSGKSTIGRIFSGLGAFVVAADEIARKLMQPGEEVYAAIVRQFGPAVLSGNGSLDRKALAELAFERGQADALNRIVHPATVSAEKEWMRGVIAQHPSAVAVVESALIFEAQQWGTAPGWAEYFDRLVLVTAPDEVKISRFVERSLAASGFSDGNDATHGPDGQAALRPALMRAAELDARARLAMQISDREKAPRCHYVIVNAGPLEETRREAEKIYSQLVREAAGEGRSPAHSPESS